MEATGCCSSHANNILHAWQDGEIDCDELFNPKRKTTYKPRKTTGVGTPNWRGFSNESRSHNLDKLKPMGTWERTQPEPEGFISHTKGHVVSRTTKGIYLRGD